MDIELKKSHDIIKSKKKTNTKDLAWSNQFIKSKYISQTCIIKLS